MVKEGESAWTKAELKEVLDELHEHRDRLVAVLESRRASWPG